jgi:hypothetical protein
MLCLTPRSSRDVFQTVEREDASPRRALALLDDVDRFAFTVEQVEVKALAAVTRVPIF